MGVGPPECAATAFSAPESCVPRWRWSGTDAAGAPCEPTLEADCNWSGRRCTPDELATGEGCSAGAVGMKGGPCQAAGSFSGSGVAPEPAGAAAITPQVPPLSGGLPQGAPAHDALPSLASTIPAGVPALGALPDLHDTFFCRDGPQGAPRFCPASGPQTCVRGADGSLPDAALCAHVGVPWASRYCPPGFVVDKQASVPAGALPPCLPDPGACGEDVYGDPTLSDSDGTRFVDAANGNDSQPGTRSAPYKTLGAAVAATPVSGTVVLAAGTYAGGVALTHSLTLRGRCAAKSHIVGPAGKAALTIQGGQTGGLVVVQGVKIGGQAIGVEVSGPLAARLQRVRVHAATRHGLQVSGPNAHLEVVESVVEATLPSPPDADHGEGAAALDGATLVLRDVRASGNRTAGVRAAGSGTKLQATRLLVDATLARQSDKSEGVGLAIGSGAAATVNRVRLTGNRGFGLFAVDKDTRLDAAGLLVDDTRPREAGKTAGLGMLLQGGATVTLHAARLSGNRAFGLFVSDAGTTLDATGLLVDGTLPQEADKKLGRGVGVHKGAAMTLQGARCSGNRDKGVVITGAGTTAAVSQLLVDATLPQQSDGSTGWGLGVTAGAALSLSAARLAANSAVALVVSDVGTKVNAAGLLVHDTGPRKSDGALGRGVDVYNGAALTLGATRLSANHQLGLRAAGAGTKVIADGLLVDAAPGLGDEAGDAMGISVQAGARLTLDHTRLSGNRVVALQLFDPQTTVHATRLLIDGTRPRKSDDEDGWGVDVHAGASLTVSDTRLTGNHAFGLFALGKGTEVVASNLVVDGTLPQHVDGTYGWGIGVTEGAVMRAERVRLSGNRAFGMVVRSPETVVHASDLLIDATLPRSSDTAAGLGVLLEQGAKLRLLRARLSGNRSTGLLARDPGTALEAWGLLVDATLPLASNDAFGRGVQVQQGARATLLGVRLAGHRDSAMVATGEKVRVDAVGLIAESTAPQASNQNGGTGVWLVDGVVATFTSCALRNNLGAALGVSESALQAQGLSVLSTGWGRYPEVIGTRLTGKIIDLANGVVIIGSPQTSVERSLVAGNPGAGVLIDSSPGVSLTHSLIDAGGGMYGLVVQNTQPAHVAHNAIVGAGVANMSSDEVLSVPAAPTVSVSTDTADPAAKAETAQE